MQPAGLLPFLFLVACTATSGPKSVRAVPGAAAAADLSRGHALIAESQAALETSDYSTARALSAEAVALLLARPQSEQDEAWSKLLDSAGRSAYAAQDARTANTAWQRVFDVRRATLPDEHPDVRAVRGNLAMTLRLLGDLAGARVLEEESLAIDLRTLPDDHPELQASRGNLALTIRALGDLEGSRALSEKVLEVHSRTLPDDHPDLQRARQNHAETIAMLGDLPGALALERKVLEVRTRTLPDDHHDLQGTRQNLAGTLFTLGDLAAARALFEKVLEVRLRTLPDDHPQMQNARQNLAATLHELGELDAARILSEKVLEVRSRQLPEDHPDLQAARNNLALSIKELGDLASARVLQQRVLDVLSRTMPDDHPDLQTARSNLALTLWELGDFSGARALQEGVLEVRSRTLPDEHRALQGARGNLAATLRLLGDLDGARALGEIVLEVFSRTLPDENPDLQMARGSLAMTLSKLGDLAAARILEEQVLEIRSRTLPDEHPDVQLARGNLARTLFTLGDLGDARALLEKVLDVGVLTLPDEHPDLQAARANLALTTASQSVRASHASRGDTGIAGESAAARQRSTDLVRALCRAQAVAARDAIVGSPPREAEERCSRMAEQIDVCLSFAFGFGAWEPLRTLEAESFLLAETTRGAAIVSAELTRKAASAPRYAELREALGTASAELATLAQKGTNSAEFDRARTRRESVERELVALALELSGGTHSGLELDVDALATRLGAREAAVGFWRFKKWRVDVVDELDSTGQPAVRATAVDSLCAFVVRSANPVLQDEPASSPLTLVDLGPIAPIAETVSAWRDGLGVGSDERGISAPVRDGSTGAGGPHGNALRRLIFDPLLPALAGTQRIVVALDDVLHLVPIDALPLDDGALIGDRWQIETCTTLTGLLRNRERSTEPGQLVAFGDVEYGAEEATGEAEAPTRIVALDVEPRADEDAGILRGSAWSGGFPALPATGVEVRGIARGFREQFAAEAHLELCEHADASRARLLFLAPNARWLHIATHGWFAPESIHSWNDAEPLDEKRGLGERLSGADQVRGMSPMLLCGLALAGANAPEDAVGRIPGLVTADELSTLDLSSCELVVLSACDTNVGERRAGQGVASLQKALQMAGARSVITSSWKVPDEATKELMIDFYRRLWVEKKPKHQALWEAKTKLRNAQDEHGNARTTTRDWAAWVLTGEPD